MVLCYLLLKLGHPVQLLTPHAVIVSDHLSPSLESSLPAACGGGGGSLRCWRPACRSGDPLSFLICTSASIGQAPPATAATTTPDSRQIPPPPPPPCTSLSLWRPRLLPASNRRRRCYKAYVHDPLLDPEIRIAMCRMTNLFETFGAWQPCTAHPVSTRAAP